MTIPGIFSQTDGRWGPQELGLNNDPYYNLYHFGCVVTAVANMLWWNGNTQANPGTVNAWLQQHGGFEAGGGNLIWEALQPLLDQVNMVARGYSTDLNAVNAFLADENSFAIVWITKPGFPMHFSAMPYIGQIADSWDAQLKPITSYTFHGAHLYSKNAPLVVPAPAPEPVPVAAPTVIPPIVDPVPAPTPSVETPVPDPNPPVQVPVVPGMGNGQPQAEAVPVNILADLPPLPEFEETYRPFPDGIHEIHLKEDTIAFDMTGVGAPKAVYAARPMLAAGTFSDNGRVYYRGTSGGWYGVSAEDVFEASPASPPVGPAGPPVWSILAKLITDPMGALIRLISRLHP
jgi:hypothetical protein